MPISFNKTSRCCSKTDFSAPPGCPPERDEEAAGRLVLDDMVMRTRLLAGLRLRCTEYSNARGDGSGEGFPGRPRFVLYLQPRGYEYLVGVELSESEKGREEQHKLVTFVCFVDFALAVGG